MKYTVYVLGPEVKAAEDEAVAPALPEGADLVLVTASQDEVVTAIKQLVRAGYNWAGNEWLESATFRCTECGQPAGPDGQGGFRHAGPADAAACVMFGGGMLRSLFEEE